MRAKIKKKGIFFTKCCGQALDPGFCCAKEAKSDRVCAKVLVRPLPPQDNLFFRHPLFDDQEVRRVVPSCKRGFCGGIFLTDF